MFESLRNMKQDVLRIFLTALALIMVLAGSLNLNRVGANAPAGLCRDCGCTSGTVVCCAMGGVVCFGEE